MRELKTVVITGASRGLGLASAKLLYQQGWRVVAAMRSVDEGSQRLCAATGATKRDPRLVCVALNLSDPASIDLAANSILELVGAPDVLVHNAGIAAAGSAEDTPIEVWYQLFATNVFGPVALTKALLPSLRAAGRGRIVAIASQVGIRGLPGVAPYSASKSALERWAESLSAEIAPFGLKVTVLVTGAFKTEILTEQTPDYGNYSGPYAPHYAGIRRTGGAMVDKAAAPERFAQALAKALGETATFSRHTVGPDAAMLAMMARLLPGRLLQALISPLMGLPRFGSLRNPASRE